MALDRTLEEFPELVVEAERIAAHSTHWTMPCIWIANGYADDLDEALSVDPTIETIVENYEFEDEEYYQVEWEEEVVDRIDAYVDREASILSARGSADGWRVRIRFASRDQFEDFRDHLTERGHSYELRELVEPGAPRQSYGNLTPQQRDALAVATEEGYYDVPRGISAEELAGKLEISQSALSERLQRGVKNLVDSTLTTRRQNGQAE